jgi:DNA-binding IclR family transcriptional regulator
MPRRAALSRARNKTHAAGGPQLLDRTFAILSVFSPEAPEWTTTEAAHARDLPVPTVHRILTALERHGFVERDDVTKRFRLGRAALELGRLARSSMDLRSASLPILRRLAMETGETALLTTLSADRTRSVCLERVESSHDLRLSVVPGRQMDLHAGANQKALLSHMNPDEIENIIRGGLNRICRATINDPDLLRSELLKIRRRGWATSYEETNLGVWGIGITLLDEHHGVVAAVGLAGPRVRVPPTRVENVLDVLRSGTAEIAEQLGLRTSIQVAAESKERRNGRSRNLEELADELS